MAGTGHLPYGVSALWNAQSLAVVGASDRPGSIGGTVLDHLRRARFRGAVYPVHPTADTVRGLPAHRTVGDIGERVDLALLVIPAPAVEPTIVDCINAGVAAIIVTASGFADSGDTETERRLARRCAEAGVRLLGPNCIGSANLHSGLVAGFSPMFTGFDHSRPGGLGVVSHSGGIGFGIASLAAERGLRPGWVVTTGNEADLTVGEVMWVLASLPECTGVVAYLESVPDDSWLQKVAATGKPVAALLSGNSAAGAAAAVTRSRSGEHSPHLLTRHGIAVTTDIGRLLDGASLFGTPPVAGDRIAVVTTSGGAGILAADAVDRSRFRLADLSDRSRGRLSALLPEFAKITNPLDVTASVIGDPALLIESLRTLVDDDGCDAVLVSLCVLGERQAEAAAGVIAAAAGAKPIVVSRTGADSLSPGLRPLLADAGIGVFSTPDAAVAALDMVRT